MVMDADAVEARRLTTGGECGDIRQRSPNRHSEIDADPRHQTEAPSFSRPTIRGILENENRAKRFLPCNPSTRDSESRVGIATVVIFHLKSPNLHTHWATLEHRLMFSPCPRLYPHFSWSPSAADATWGKVALGRAAGAAGIYVRKRGNK